MRTAICGNQVCEAGEQPTGINSSDATGAFLPFKCHGDYRVPLADTCVDFVKHSESLSRQVIAAVGHVVDCVASAVFRR